MKPPTKLIYIVLVGAFSALLAPSVTSSAERDDVNGSWLPEFSASGDHYYTRAARKAAEQKFKKMKETNTASADEIGTIIERFPVIRLIVKPMPPTDYKVEINGEDCPFTLVYVVPKGPVRLLVTHIGQKACNWNGKLSDDQVQYVTCTF